MPINIDKSAVSVLLLFNLEPGWSASEREEVFRISLQLGDAIGSIGHNTTLIPVTDDDLNVLLAPYDPLEHVVFNWCEGIPGVAHSEWQVAAHLELNGFTFTGADSAAIALAQDKCRVKQLLDNVGIQTPRWQSYNDISSVSWTHFPAIVKAAREHCSEGIDRHAVVTTDAELRNRISYILEKYRQPALVEEFIDGRELHVSLVGNDSIDMLPPVEMEFSLVQDKLDRICSYEAKFNPESDLYRDIKTVLPAPLNEEELRDIEQICKDTYMLTGCRDYARIDLRIRDSNVYVLDVNPNADISPDTSTVLAAEFAGYSYGELGGLLVNLAAKRHPAREGWIYIGNHWT